MGALRSLFGKATDYVGTQLGLPEFGLSERTAGGNTQRSSPFLYENLLGIPTANAATGQVGGARAYQQYGSPIGPQPLTISGASPGGPSGSAAFQVRSGRAPGEVVQEPANPYLTNVAENRKATEAASKRNLANVKGGITNSYGGVFENLDAQLAGLPGLQESAQGDINTAVEGQRAGIESGRQRSLQGLDQSEEGIRTQTKGNLRNLAEDVRNQLKAAGQYIGGLGAGDSSASGIAAGAVGKYGLKQRGMQLEQEQQLVQQINNQRLQVDQIANEEMQKVESQKQLQLSQIAREFQGIMQDLQNRKANASFQEQQQLTQAEQDIVMQLEDRLGGLDSEVRQYQQNVQVWNQQRQAELQDYSAKQAVAGTFTKEVDPYVKAGNLLKSLVASGYSQEQARQYVQQQTGIFINSDQSIDYDSLLTQEKLKQLQLENQQQSQYLAPQQQQTGFLGSIGNALLPGQPF